MHTNDVPLVGGARSKLLFSLWVEFLFVFKLLFHFDQVFTSFLFWLCLFLKSKQMFFLGFK